MNEQKEHSHIYNETGNNKSLDNKNIAWAIVVNIFITITEVIVGLLIGSLALISDALHNFSDVGSMVLSWWG